MRTVDVEEHGEESLLLWFDISCCSGPILFLILTLVQ